MSAILNTYSIATVLHRMYNWKFEAAYNQALQAADFPADALSKLQHLSETYGNYGWTEGPDTATIREINESAANLLGFKFDDDKQYWVKL